jgi:hypothetical protein
MQLKRILLLALLAAFLMAIFAIAFPAPAGPLPASADVNIFASPVQAGCYRAKPTLCKIHVEPFTINLANGQKLVYFQLLASRSGAGSSSVIYDFRPDLSNPVPFSGNTFTPSRVAKDFAAQCGETYSISLQGRDTGDPNPYNLGSTAQFTCPIGDYRTHLPAVNR